MKQRVITAAVMIAVALPCIILGGTLLRILLAIVTVLGTYEYVKNVVEEKGTIQYALSAVMVIFTLLCIFFEEYSASLRILLLIGLFFLNVHFEHFDILKISYLYLMFSLITVGLSCFDSIRELGFPETLMIFFLTYVTDSFALIGGMKFGKHKLNERISPNKTIEGSVCGYLCGAAVGIVYGLLATSYPKAVIFCAGLLIPIVSQLGDLAFSSIKRYFKIKDFSNIFPGHGGMLDRIDSLIFALAAFYIIIEVL